LNSITILPLFPKLKPPSDDIQLAAGVMQTCAADAGAAIHAMKNLFEKEVTEAVILIDANNAFNTINCQAALHNINILCPSFSTILQYIYGLPIRLFIAGEGELLST